MRTIDLINTPFICYFEKKIALAKIYFSVINDLVSDQRVDRMIQTLTKAGYQVCLTGRKLPWSPPLERRDYQTYRMNLWVKKGFAFYAWFNIRLFFYLISRRNPMIFVANDLDTLPASFLASSLRGVPLVYDSHEYFTEVPELIQRDFVRKFWLRLEKWILPRLRFAITVSDPIAEAYREKYGTDFHVVYNYPLRKRNTRTFPLPQMANNTRILLYQGSVNVGRGLELLISAIESMQEVLLVIAGDGDIREELEIYVRNRKLSDKIHFTGRIPPDALNGLTSQAHAGVSLEEDLGLNYRYALPNKLFDYIQAKIPVLVSDLPEMRKLLVQYPVGLVAGSRDPESIRKQLELLLFDEKKRQEWKKNLTQASVQLCWENQENKILDLFLEASMSKSRN